MKTIFAAVLCALCFCLSTKAAETSDSGINKIKHILRKSLCFKLIHGKCGPCLKAKSPNLGCDCTNLEPRKDCLEFYKKGFKRNGIYRLTSGKFTTTTNAYCDQTTQGGGWTVIQRRKDGSVNFDRTWKDYKNGFGKLTGEFWFGNDMIHHLTAKSSQLLVNMKMHGSTKPVYAKYASFQVSDEEKKYTLKISGYSGTTKKNGMATHNGMKFTTKDQDNDIWLHNCATTSSGGWWFHQCFFDNLNGKYGSICPIQLMWWMFPGERPKFVEMKVRRNE